MEQNLTPLTALHKVLHTAELVEQILFYTALFSIHESQANTRLEPIQTLSSLCLVNRLFASCIKSSHIITEVLHGPFPEDNEENGFHDFQTQITHGLHWIFDKLGIEITYLTYTDEGTTEVRILHEIKTGRYVDCDGREVANEHLEALERYIQRYGENAEASWRGMRLLRGEDGNVLTFRTLEFFSVSATAVEDDDFGQYPLQTVGLTEVDWTFGPQATLGMFFDAYAEIMRRSPEEQYEVSQRLRKAREVETREWL